MEKDKQSISQISTRSKRMVSGGELIKSKEDLYLNTQDFQGNHMRSPDHMKLKPVTKMEYFKKTANYPFQVNKDISRSTNQKDSFMANIINNQTTPNPNTGQSAVKGLRRNKKTTRLRMSSKGFKPQKRKPSLDYGVSKGSRKSWSQKKKEEVNIYSKDYQPAKKDFIRRRREAENLELGSLKKKEDFLKILKPETHGKINAKFVSIGQGKISRLAKRNQYFDPVGPKRKVALSGPSVKDDSSAFSKKMKETKVRNLQEGFQKAKKEMKFKKLRSHRQLTNREHFPKDRLKKPNMNIHSLIDSKKEINNCYRSPIIQKRTCNKNIRSKTREEKSRLVNFAEFKQSKLKGR